MACSFARPIRCRLVHGRLRSQNCSHKVWRDAKTRLHILRRSLSATSKFEMRGMMSIRVSCLIARSSKFFFQRTRKSKGLTAWRISLIITQAWNRNQTMKTTTLQWTVDALRTPRFSIFSATCSVDISSISNGQAIMYKFFAIGDEGPIVKRVS